jgi:hypothetical protein
LAPGAGAPAVTSSPTCFLHLPKSGGTSIHAALTQALGLEAVSPRRCDAGWFCGFDAFDQLAPESRAMIAVDDAEIEAMGAFAAVSGHFGLPTLLRIAPPSSIATVLREPRARLLSTYAYWRSAVGNAWRPYDVFDHAYRPLEEFLLEPEIAPAIDNHACRRLLSAGWPTPTAGFIEPGDHESIATAAIEQLDTLGFVGVLELGERLWGGLGEQFGVALAPTRLAITGVGEQAVKPGGFELTAPALAALNQRTAADRIVYEHALVRAGVADADRAQLCELAFLRQLVRLGDVLGRSAAELATASEQLATTSRQLGSATEQLATTSEQLATAAEQLQIVYGSRSWRVTEPLRKLGSVSRSRNGA